MVKGFRQIVSLTVVSRILGLVRDIAFAYFFGASRLFGAWAIAFKIPNLSRRLFGEGAASASFIPVYSEELHHRPESANKLACTVVTVVAVILAVIVLAGEAVIWIYYSLFSDDPDTDLMLQLSSIMMPYMILICVVAIIAGILNSHRHFAAPAAAPVVLNIFIIGSLCFSGWVLSLKPDRQVFIVAIAVILAGVVQFLMQLIPLRIHRIQLRPAWQVRSDAFKKILILMGPMILGMTVTQINTLSDDVIGWLFSSSAAKGEYFTWFGRQIRYPLPENVNAHLYFSQRLYQMPLGVLGISLATAIFPVMSADAARKDYTALLRTISKALRSAVFIALPATAGLILIRNLLVSTLFERGEFTQSDSVMTASVLSFYALGLCGFFLQQIVTRAFYSLQDSKMPARTAVIAVLVNLVLNLTLIWFMAAAGLAVATAVCSYLQVAILMSVLGRRFDGIDYRSLALTAAKSIAATAVMYLVGMTILKSIQSWPDSLSFNVLRLSMTVIGCAFVYTLAARLLRIEVLSLLTGRRKN